MHVCMSLCSHMENKHAFVQQCESVQIYVPVMKKLRITCLADVAYITCVCVHVCMCTSLCARACKKSLRARMSARVFKSKFQR